MMKKFGLFTKGLIISHYCSMIQMTKLVLKSSYYSFTTYNFSSTNICSHSFQWVLNQTLFSCKCSRTTLVIWHDISFIPMTIGQNHLFALFNVLKDILEQCQIFIHQKKSFILLKCLVNDLFMDRFTIYIYIYINNLIF